MRNKLLLPFLFILSIVVSLAVIFSTYITYDQNNTSFAGKAETMLDGWTTQSGEPSVLPGTIGTNTTPTLTRILPQSIADDTVLTLRTNYILLGTSIDGLSIVSRNAAPAAFGESLKQSYYIIPIPADRADTPITLYLSAPGDVDNARIYDIKFGDAIAVAGAFVRESIYTVAVFFVMAASLIFIGGQTLFLRRRSAAHRTRRVIWLALFVALGAAWVLSDSSLMLLLTVNSAVTYYISIFSFMLLSVPLLLYVQSILHKPRTVLNAAAGLIMLNFAVCVILKLAGFYELSVTIASTHILGVAAALTIAIVCIIDFVQTRNQDALAVFIGLIVLEAFGIAGAVLINRTGDPSRIGFLATGLMLFALTLAAAALRHNLTRTVGSISFESLTSLIPSGICQLENFQTSQIVEANEFFYKMFGYTKKQALAAGFTSVYFTVHPDDVAPMKQKIKKQFAVSAERFETEARHYTRSGKIIWVITRYRLDVKSPGLITATMIDITDRKLMEERLRISEEEYRIATRNSNRMILRLDIPKRVGYRQPDAKFDFGLGLVIDNLPDVITDSRLLAEDSVATMRGFFDAIYRGDYEGNVIISMRSPTSEEYRWYNFDFTTIFGDDGAPAHSIITYYDITLQRQKELAFRRWQQSYNALPKNATNIIEYNLTDDVIEREEGEMIPSIPVSVPRRLADVAEYIASNNIYSDDADAWLEFMSRDRLLKRFADNNNTDKAEFRRLSNGEPMWMSVTIELISDPYSSDIKAYFHLEDIDDQKQAELHLQERSMRDSLTGLLNRGSFVEQFNEIMRKSDLETQHALIMLDLDNFKTINDTLGHSTGDTLLVSIANKLKYALRSDDLCGRLGGDEFAICLRNMNLGKPLEIRVKELCNLIGEMQIKGVNVSASFGVAGFPYDGLTFEELYEKSDVALYTAKAQGRGGYAVYDPQLSFDDISAPNK